MSDAEASRLVGQAHRLPDPVTSIDAGCTHLFPKRPGVIVLQWDGFSFDAVRQKHWDAGSPKPKIRAPR